MWAGYLGHVAPFVEQWVAPAHVLALGAEVDDVEMQGRCIVGQLDELPTACVRGCRVEHVDECDGRKHT